MKFAVRLYDILKVKNALFRFVYCVVECTARTLA